MIIPDLLSLAVDVSTLQLMPGNPRRGDVDAVARSLEQFGQRKAIVARRHDRVVVAGNHTLQAVRRLGWPEIACVWVDDDAETSAAFALADNRVADLGDYDQELLVALLAQVSDADLMAATGYTDADLAALLAASSPPPEIEDPDAVPVSAPSLSVVGDVWLLGPHRLMCGDSTKPTDLEHLMAGCQADLVWTDPPYGVSYVGKTADALTIDNDDLSAVELESFLRVALGNACDFTKPGGGWFVAAPAGPLFVPFGVVLAELGIWRQTLVWVKDVFVMGRSDYHYRHEALFYGWKPGAPHHAPPDRTRDTVWEIDRPRRSSEHPTMKPVALIEKAIEAHTTPGQVVLDVFGGSGSTLIACHLTSRHARLMELDPTYADVICRRWQEATGILPIAEATNNEHDFCADAPRPPAPTGSGGAKPLGRNRSGGKRHTARGVTDTL